MRPLVTPLEAAKIDTSISVVPVVPGGPRGPPWSPVVPRGPPWSPVVPSGPQGPGASRLINSLSERPQTQQQGRAGREFRPRNDQTPKQLVAQPILVARGSSLV